MQNFVEIHQRNPELLSSGGFRPPPRLGRGIERPRLDRVKALCKVKNSQCVVLNTLNFPQIEKEKTICHAMTVKPLRPLFIYMQG